MQTCQELFELFRFPAARYFHGATILHRNFNRFFKQPKKAQMRWHVINGDISNDFTLCRSFNRGAIHLKGRWSSKFAFFKKSSERLGCSSLYAERDVGSFGAGHSCRSGVVYQFG